MTRPRVKPQGRTGIHASTLRILVTLTAFLVATLELNRAHAWVLSEDPFEEKSTDLGIIARSFAFLNAGPILEPPFAPQSANPAGQSIFDTRLYASHKTSTYRLVIHNQSSLSLSSLVTSGALNLGKGVPPPRLFPLTFSHEQDNLRLQNSTDWIFGELRFEQLTLTVGRQPVSFGRGSLFKTNDLVSTFSLTQVDRTFKPGADAIRLDWSLANQQNILLLGSLGNYTTNFGASADGSTALLQYKHGGSAGEFSVLGGYVRGDALLSIDGVTSLLGFDLYSELTGTITTENSLAAPSVDEKVFIKALVGATFRPSAKLSIVPEFYYGGNGAKGPEDYLPLLASKRFQIGDQPSVGRYYLSVANIWEATPLSTISWGMMINMIDPSALWYSSLNQSLSDNTSAQLGVYAPIGNTPRPISGPLPYEFKSEFGAYPYFVFAQLSATL